MQPQLPLELHIVILRHLSALSSSPESDHALLNSALVCRSWVPISRSLSFRHISFTFRHARGDVRFLNLLENPHETFSQANIQRLSFRECASWMYAAALSSIASSPAAFSNLRELELIGTNFWRISEVARERLMWSFTTVTTLVLCDVRFHEYSYYISFMHSFPKLKKALMKRCRCDGLSTAVIPIQSSHGCSFLINTLELNQCETPLMCLAFSPCPRLTRLTVRSGSLKDRKVHDQESVLVNEILRSAGSSLKVFEVLEGSDLTVSGTDGALTFYTYMIEAGLTVLATGHYIYTNLDLSFNTNLHQIHFEPLSGRSQDWLLLFLQHLLEIHQNKQSNLQCLNLPFATDYIVDWAAVDNVLQEPAFASLKEIRCGRFACFFTENDTPPRPAEGVKWEPHHGSEAVRELDRAREAFRMQLPRCDKRGLVYLNDAEYVYEGPY
uniref:F-box domain-containing protein n=1 Tax=Moniliophthora roreri TaxID=221103 RepID=A0A0W0F523_MONRR